MLWTSLWSYSDVGSRGRCLRFSSSPESVDLPVCNETVRFSRGFGGDVGVDIFRAPPGCPGVERQFSEPSMVKSSLPSRAPAQLISVTSGYTLVDFLSSCQKQQQQQAVHPKSALFFRHLLRMDLSEQPSSGAAQRRRQRRLRSWLRHERMTVAMALAESTHHAAPRTDECEGRGVGARVERYGHDPGPPPPPSPPPHTHTPASALQPLRRRAWRDAAGQDRYPVRATGAGCAAHRAADCRCSPSGSFSR